MKTNLRMGRLKFIAWSVNWGPNDSQRNVSLRKLLIDWLNVWGDSFAYVSC